jgi:hypothetical protein
MCVFVCVRPPTRSTLAATLSVLEIDMQAAGSLTLALQLFNISRSHVKHSSFRKTAELGGMIVGSRRGSHLLTHEHGFTARLSQQQGNAESQFKTCAAPSFFPTRSIRLQQWPHLDTGNGKADSRLRRTLSRACCPPCARQLFVPIGSARVLASLHASNDHDIYCASQQSSPRNTSQAVQRDSGLVTALPS